jgi:tetratricopeptide (TPR) repeat protein/mono/diheme cytochrome c family protein
MSVARALAGLTVVISLAAGPFAVVMAQTSSADVSSDASSARPVTFSHDVAPIIFAHCSGCHRPGESAPFSLLTYADAKQRAALIASVTASHVMPPWQPDSAPGELQGDRRLSPEQIATLSQWAASGAVEGDPQQTPPTPVFAAGWRMGPPDLIVTMAEPFTVPAGGPDVFRNFVLPVPLAERRFVRAFEFRPGNPRVLHHARVLLDDTGEVRRLDGKDPAPGFGGMEAPGARFPDGHFLGWAPGRNPTREAFQWPIEPGTDLVVQMHLTPSGRPEQVQASIGLYLTDEPPAAAPMMLRLGAKTIDIEPGATAYDLNDSYLLPVDVSLLSIYPHAHYLGRQMTVTAERPDGSTQSLLHIPNWNFNWQDEYVYATPIALPRGTRVTMRYLYDNSAGNPRNPSSPPRRVRFGPDTTDEMGELLLQVLPAQATDLPRLRADAARKNLLADVAGEEKRIVDVPGDYETRNALGVAYVQLGRVPDALSQFEQALRLAPGHAVSNYNVGVIAMGQQRPGDAITWFERALAAQPDYVEARNNLGIALELTGRPVEAMAHYQAALAVRPGHTAAHNNLGRVLLAQPDVARALEHFRAALRTQPDNPDVLYNLGRALIASGEPDQAASQWRRGLSFRPESLPLLIDLARLLATDPALRDPVEATALAERANRVSGGTNPAVLDVLAAAHAASNRLDAAIQTAEDGLRRAESAGNDRLVGEIRQRLQHYQQLRRSAAAGPGIP